MVMPTSTSNAMMPRQVNKSHALEAFGRMGAVGGAFIHRLSLIGRSSVITLRLQSSDPRV